MSITDLSPETLRELLSLAQQKQVLQTELTAIDARIAKFGISSPVPLPKAPSPNKKPVESHIKAPKLKRGGLKDAVIAALTGKPQGMSVPELAKATGAKATYLHVFLGKAEGFERVSRGMYALKS